MKKILILIIILAGVYVVLERYSPEYHNFVFPKTRQADKTFDWKIYRNQPGKFELSYPPEWTINPDPSEVRDLVTTRFVTRKTTGFEIQSPQDENRNIVVRDGWILVQRFLKKFYYKPSVFGDGHTEPFKCISPKQIFSYKSNDTIFVNLLNQRIEVCWEERVEDASYPDRFTAYIPIDQSEGMVFEGSYSIESKVSPELFVETFSQILSTFKFME